jgi:hypothetical protein
MTRDELTAKFERNAAAVLDPARRRALIAAVQRLESEPDSSQLVQQSLAG